MNKTITLSKNADGLLIKCGGSEKSIIINDSCKSINAKELYDLLNYQSGDKYYINRNAISEDDDIVNPVIDLLSNIIKQVNELPLVNAEVNKDLKKVEIKEA